MKNNMTPGVVGNLYHFPVKSLLGEECDLIKVNQRGAENDRLYAIVDVNGKFGSHKSTRRFRKMSGLFDLKAEVRDGTVWILFSDGQALLWSDPATSGRLSELVGQAVTLEPEAEISHFDDSAIHLITSASLLWLQNLLPKAQIDPRRFRPNIIIDCEGSGRIEEQWIGSTVKIGTCEFEIVSSAERCLMTTLAQDDLPQDSSILTTIGREAGLNFGVYAKVISAGVVATGDRLSF